MDTKFMVNGQEKEVSYKINGIDNSGDFIGNTAHGMTSDDEGRYIASQEDYDWWVATIDAHIAKDDLIAAYKDKFDRDEVDQIVQDWAGGDLDSEPAQIKMGLEEAFGVL
jgi:hypothetical protein